MSKRNRKARCRPWMRCTDRPPKNLRASVFWRLWETRTDILVDVGDRLKRFGSERRLCGYGGTSGRKACRP